MESLTYFLDDILADGRDPKRRAHSVSASPVMLLSSSVLLEILSQTSWHASLLGGHSTAPIPAPVPSHASSRQRVYMAPEFLGLCMSL